MDRGHSVLEKRWVYGYLFVAESKDGKKQYQILQPDYFIGLHKMFVVEPDSVESYMRYDDRNGNQIYENDMIIATVSSGQIISYAGCSAAYLNEAKQYAGRAVINKGVACMEIKKEHYPEIEKIMPDEAKSLFIPLHTLEDLSVVTNTEKINHIEKRP